MKNIFLKTSKFISSRLIYLIIGIFIAVSITFVYAAWNEAKTGGSGQLSQSNWNTLVNEIHSKCGSNCDVSATGATASSNTLTETNWNNLIDFVSNTLVDCTADNNGKCFINQTSKSALDTDLAADNIKPGVTIFGVTGAAKGLGTACSASGECTSGYCVDGVCCNNACSGSTCQRCDNYSVSGSGICGYVSSSAQDPDNECPGTLGTCAATTCSGSGYNCGYLSGQLGCSTCYYCTGGSYSCTAATTNWNVGLYGCTGSWERCYSGSCITCGGWMNANYCWYAGSDDYSCTSMCSSRGGVYNGTCDWVNDPANCSTCKHYYPAYTTCLDYEKGPCRDSDSCRYHKDGYNDCSYSYPGEYRMCACNR